LQTTLETRAADVRANQNDKDWRKIWPEEDLGLILYDVFDVDQREEGFRWFTEEELERARSDKESEEMKTSSKLKKKDLPTSSLTLFEGKAITPRASFFHAKIEESRMDCHPDRVKILPPRGKEVI
jgi:CRISPR-associated protein Cas5d